MMPGVCFLPITEATVRDVVRHSSRFDLSALAVPQLAALAVLRSIPEILSQGGDPARRAECRLARNIDSLNGNPTLVDSASRKLSTETSVQRVEDQLERLDEVGLEFLEEEDVREMAYLNPDRSWNFQFTERMAQSRHASTPYTFALSAERKVAVSDNQFRLLHELDAAADEPHAIEGYAGTGKTWVICALLDAAAKQNHTSMLLARTSGQISAVRGRLRHKPSHSFTFGNLAGWLIENSSQMNARRLTSRWRKRAKDDKELAELLGVGCIGSAPAWVVARWLRQIIARYCYSSNEEIETGHIPGACWRRLGVTDRCALVEYAAAFWWRTVDVSSEHNDLPIRDYHLLKYAALSNMTLPEHVGMVVVDEAHEMPAPLMQILDSSPQPITTFSDRYQRMKSKAPRRRGGIRSREFSQSVRAGRQTEGYVNAALRSHSEDPGPMFVGARDRTTSVQYYAGNAIPEAPCTILATDYWELFEWFQRLAKGSSEFSLIGGSAARIDQFGRDCVLLFNEGLRPKHSYLFRYQEWEELAREESASRSFQMVQTMLEKGFGRDDLEASLRRVTSADAANYHLGLVDDAKNAEFDRVMLAPSFGFKLERPDCDPDIWSKLYIGGTRGRFHVLLPQHVRDWEKGGRDGGG